MPSPSTTTFVHRIESDAKLLASISRMYVESIADSPACRKAVDWRPQLRYLLKQFGRDLVIETLTEDVDGLSTRHAMVLADLAEQEESNVWSAKA